MGTVDRDHTVAAASKRKATSQATRASLRLSSGRSVSREDVMRSRMNDLAGELCDGDALPLVLAFAERHRFSPRPSSPDFGK